jgi:hypothetical protein
MRRMVIVTIAAAAAASCGGGPGRSDVVVDWTFGGLSCTDAEVDTIQFDIAGEVLSPNQFKCADAPVGVDLGSFLFGDYQMTITGLDGAGVPTHQIAQTIQVRGAQRGRTCAALNLNTDVCDELAIDVPRVANSTEANLTWTFSPGGDCATANVQQVTIFVDPNPDGTGGINAGTVDCASGQPAPGQPGVPVRPLTVGMHSFAISGLRQMSDGLHLVYRTHSPVSTTFQQSAITDVRVGAESPP